MKYILENCVSSKIFGFSSWFVLEHESLKTPNVFEFTPFSKLYFVYRCDAFPTKMQGPHGCKLKNIYIFIYIQKWDMTCSYFHEVFVFFIYNFFSIFYKRNHISCHTVFMYNMMIFMRLSWTEKKNVYMWILWHTVMCAINICFSFSIFSIFYQKIIFGDIQCLCTMW